MKVAVSFLSSDNYKDCILKINESNADLLHTDMCDGKYVSSNNFEINSLIKLLEISTKPIDLHLMCKEPLEYIKKLIHLNINCIFIHLNSMKSPLETIKFIKDNHIKVGIAINPDEDITILDNYLNMIDEVLIMSVVPGKGGQKFIPEVLSKIDYLKKNNLVIGIDGGINDETIKYVTGKADMVVSGSYVTSGNFNERINKLKE